MTSIDKAEKENFSVGANLPKRILHLLKDRPLFYLSSVVLITVLRGIFLKLLTYPSAPDVFVGTFVSGAVAYIVFQRLERDCTVSIDQVLSQIKKQFLPLVGIGLVSGLASVLPKVLFRFVDQEFAELALTILVFLPLAILVMLIGATFIAVVAVCVVEERDFIASFRRSMELTRSVRWHICILLIVYSVAFGFPSYLLENLFASIIGLLLPSQSLLVEKTSSLLFSGIFSVYMYVISVVIYHDLLELKSSRRIAESPAE